jgi:hypothetical protein
MAISGGAQRGPSMAAVLGLALGLAALAACITLMFLAMRAVMGVGGTCAEGGPYVIETPCPTGSTAALLIGLFGLFGAWAVASVFGLRVGGIWAATPIFGWSGLFIALGWNFLEGGLRAEGGMDITGLLLGAMFWAMGGIPLVVTLLGTRKRGPAATGAPGSTARTVTLSGPGFTSYGIAPDEGRSAPRPATAASQAVRSELLGAIARDLDAAGSRSAAGSASTPGQAADSAHDGEALVAHLERLADMHERGLLDDAEYEAAKAPIVKALEAMR